MYSLLFTSRKYLGYDFKVVILILPFILSFLNCGVSKNSVVNDQEIILDEHPKILFINFQANKKQDGTIALKLLNKIVTEGKAKEKPRYNRLKNDDWECLQLDSDEKILQHIFLENPFFKHVEYLNEQGEFEIKTLEFDSVQIPIRLQLHKDSKFVTLRTSEKDKKDKPIEIITSVE